jgi:hypothetical protein
MIAAAAFQGTVRRPDHSLSHLPLVWAFNLSKRFPHVWEVFDDQNVETLVRAEILYISGALVVAQQ